MKIFSSENTRKFAIILIGVLLTVVLYQILWKPDSSSPLGNFGLVTKADRQLADGIWGDLGFYENPKDNIVTYILIGFVVISIVYRFIIKPYNRFVNKPPSKSKGKKIK